MDPLLAMREVSLVEQAPSGLSLPLSSGMVAFLLLRILLERHLALETPHVVTERFISPPPVLFY